MWLGVGKCTVYNYPKPRHNCNRSKLHLDKRGNNLLIENILFSLYDDVNDWHSGTVSKNSSCKSKQKPSKNLSLSSGSIFPILTELRSEHPKNVLPEHLSNNSLRNEFESRNELIRNDFNIFIITDSKLDSYFPDSQFHILGYRLFRKDRSKSWSGLMCYINQDLPVKIVTSYKFPTNLEILPIEITLGKRKILPPRLYRPPPPSLF